MKLDFIGHEIRDGDPLWIIRGDLTRIEAYRVEDRVIPTDARLLSISQTIHEGKNSRVDLKRCWYENYLIKKAKLA